MVKNVSQHIQSPDADFFSRTRAYVETAFEAYGQFISNKPFIISLLILPLIIFLGSQLFSLRFEASIEHYLKENDPAFINYTKFRNQFGSDERVFIGITAENIVDHDTLTTLGKLQKDLESHVPYVLQVNSIINALYISGGEAGLTFGALGDLLPKKGDDLAIFKNAMKSSSLYGNQYSSPDDKLTLFSISIGCPSIEEDSLDVLDALLDDPSVKKDSEELPLCTLSNTENGEMISAIMQIKGKYQNEDFQLHVTGMPILRQFLKTTMKQDTKKFLTLSVIVIIVLLYILFGRISGVLFPLIIVCCSVSSTLGLMALMGKSFQAPTLILPSFLIAVGISGSVHVMFIFYQLLSQGNDKKHAIAKALGHSGLPVVFTGLTTAAGLASFLAATVAPIADLGLYAAIGVLFSLLYTILLLPVLIGMFPVKTGGSVSFSKISKPLHTTLSWIVHFSTNRHKPIILFCIVLLFFSLVGVSQIKLVHNPLLRLPLNSEIRNATETIGNHYPGMATIELFVNTREKEGLTNPEILRNLDEIDKQMSNYSDEFITVFNVFSIADIMREIHGNLVGSERADNMLPDNQEVIAQELLLLEGGSPGAMQQLTDTNHQFGRVTIQVPWIDAMAYDPFLNYIKTTSKRMLEGNADVIITGIVPLLSRTIHNAITSMITSYIIAFCVITVVMILLIGHFRLGLISMFPNVLPIVVTLGYMGWVKIPLDMYTLLIGSIALGLVVDDTVHFMHNFRRYFDKTGNVKRAVQLTLESSGLAMLNTTIILSSGAFIFMVSEMRNLYYFGLLTGMTILLALLADFFLAPALMALYYKDKEDL